MNLDDSAYLNGFLRSYTAHEKKDHTVYVDNLKTPFILLDKRYVLPSVPLMGVDKNSAFQFLNAVIENFPGAIQGFHVLPEARPKRDIQKLALVKHFEADVNQFIYMIKFETAYLGGAAKDEIVSPATQGYSASVLTDRIYFHAKIFSVENVMYRDRNIADFTVRRFEPSIYQQAAGQETKKKNYSELFDEIDYSELLGPVKEFMGINDLNWKLRSLYEPVWVEHMSLTLRFLNFQIMENTEYFKSFRELFTAPSERSVSAPSAEELFREYESESVSLAKKLFIHWLNRHSFERTKSSSGNPAWKIIINHDK
ncbi:MAG TPA: hypothetical protein PL048_14745 [Leptospiraceae bacterium]|nr:hypothetical protein [Leptospiraceae bacterium]HMY67621.1 hypothetical protein [Leptospiraceae bacterium]HMZ60032.1 hypothetical protein [Leptospiraceae bacterium]HNF14781.1 hypothetical protein [Leptospiraceae bacterium]HNF25145.1 hypothetical protein [Leptospiraceae bacterium]